MIRIENKMEEPPAIGGREAMKKPIVINVGQIVAGTVGLVAIFGTLIYFMFTSPRFAPPDDQQRSLPARETHGLPPSRLLILLGPTHPLHPAYDPASETE